MLSIHKLTAGDGYLYLIRQVAASDDTHRGRTTLADYYSSKERPGPVDGRGLAALRCPVSRDPNDPMVAKYWSVPEGSEVLESQMKSLFGEGLHPNAEKIAGDAARPRAGLLPLRRSGCRPFESMRGERVQASASRGL